MYLADLELYLQYEACAARVQALRPKFLKTSVVRPVNRQDTVTATACRACDVGSVSTSHPASRVRGRWRMSHGPA